MDKTGLFDEEVLYHMKYMTVDCNALFCYVLRKRLMTVLVLAVLSTTYLGLVICAGMALWYGAATGGLLAVMVLRYGMKGILLAAASMFPHYLIYWDDRGRLHPGGICKSRSVSKSVEDFLKGSGCLIRIPQYHRSVSRKLPSPGRDR